MCVCVDSTGSVAASGYMTLNCEYSRRLCHSTRTCMATAGSSEAIVTAVGCPCATSAAKLGPER